MKILKVSQIITEKSWKKHPQSLIGKTVMETLDEMAELAKKIKETKPNIKKKEAATSIQASFTENARADESVWTVIKGEETVEIKIYDLFPSGEYDISHFGSDLFKRALEMKLSKLPGNLTEATQSLIDKSKTPPEMRRISISGQMTDENVYRIVSHAIPLNDFEKDARIRLMEEFRGS